MIMISSILVLYVVFQYPIKDSSKTELKNVVSRYSRDEGRKH